MAQYWIQTVFNHVLKAHNLGKIVDSLKSQSLKGHKIYFNHYN